MTGHGGTYRMDDSVKAEIDTLAEITIRREGILVARAEQRAYQFQREAAVSLEYRLLNELDVARRLQARCDEKIEERATAISTLQDEISALVPNQRGQT